MGTTLMIVEDEKIIRMGLNKIITRSIPEIKTIVEAGSAEQGIDLVDITVPDIVLLDMKLPGKDGVWFMEQLKKTEYSGQTIILSGQTDFSYAQNALNNHAFAYLLKPIRREKLVDTINEAIKSLKNENKGSLQDSYAETSSEMGGFDKINEAKKYVEKNYMKDISLDEIALFVNFNPSYFSTLFKTKTGVSLSTYIQRVRIEKAAKMLERTDLSILEIVDSIGFNDEKYFYKIFKKHFGITPREYRINRINQ